MTVAEYIEALRELPQDVEVMAFDAERRSYYPVEEPIGTLRVYPFRPIGHGGDHSSKSGAWLRVIDPAGPAVPDEIAAVVIA